MTMRVVGKRTPRIEGPDKVSGYLRYAADLAPEGCLWGKVLRSPHAHARIVRIDTSAAERVPGVHAVLTGAQHPHWIGRIMRDLPVLAVDKVRFIGERIAAVAAESADAANEALALIEIEYEELPAVFDVPEALSPGAPLVHDDPTQYAGAFVHPERPDLPNLCSYGRWTHGDIEGAFGGSHRVFENTFVTQKEHHVYMETHACAVSVHPDGTADVWASNKSPHMLRGPTGRRDGCGGAHHPGASDARGRRLRREGLADGHSCCLPPLAGNGTPGQDRHVVPRGVARREQPSPRNNHGPHGRDGGQPRHRHADRGILRQRRRMARSSPPPTSTCTASSRAAVATGSRRST